MSGSDPSDKKTGSLLPLVWVNGNLHTDPGRATIVATDPAFMLGLGVFESLPMINSQPLCLTRHYNRMCLGASRLGFEPCTIDTIRSAIGDILNAGVTDARLRITLSGDPALPDSGSLVISAAELIVPEGNARVVTCPYTRNPQSPLAGIKSTSYADSALALRFAKRAGADEAVFCDTSGNLSEGNASNLFYVCGGQLRTPPESTGCLPGITRRLVLELCEKNGLELNTTPQPPEALAAADEAFLTTSIRRIKPIESVDQKRLPAAPGPVTTKISRWLDELLEITPDPA